MNQTFRKVRQFLNLVLVGLLIFFCVSTWNQNAFSQIPTLPQSNTELPSGVVREGLLEIKGVKLGGKEILKIASPAIFNRKELDNQIPVEVRSQQIELNLEQLINSNQSSILNPITESSIVLDPSTIRVFSETLNSQPVLFAKDAVQSEPKVLLTVTDADAQYYAVTKEALVLTWKELLEEELRQALELRKPGAFKEQTNTAVIILAGIILATILFFSLLQFLELRHKKIKQYLIQINSQINTDKSDNQVNHSFAVNHYRLDWLLEQIHHQINTQWLTKQRLQINSVLRWLTFWAIVFTWVGGAASILYLFPQTRPFARSVVSVPVLILAAWFLTGLANRLANLAIDRAIETWERNTTTVENSQRRSQRLSTTVNALKGLVSVLIYGFGVVWVLQVLNLAPASLLAFGTLLALAVSFGVQNLIKDLVNGILILLEDQYAVGDLIAIGSATGIVENVNLRITQLRSADGRLITLPNSLISQVENLSRTWSRSDFTVDVAYNTDVDKALATVLDEAKQLASDPEWEQYILSVGEIFGVEQIAHTGITIKIWIKTLPLKQFDVARELRRRLKIAFDRHGIQIGIPQQIITSSVSEQIGDRPPNPAK
jgi:moderate conductance mechanosensitive channel